MNLLAKIEETLEKLIAQRPDLPYAALFSAARYSLLSSGKRLRPLLTLAVCEGYGIPIEPALIPACAIELVHTYSLIHDDLPCMDDDDLRRGKPTLHKVYPEWHALLTGDYLLTYAFEILSTAPNLDAEQKLALVHTLAKHAGAHGMIGGQMIDLLFEESPIDWKVLEQMHLGKTAGLITASLEFGGIIARTPEKDLILLKKAGAAFGVAFQLIDDILDGPTEETKATAVTLLGVTETQTRATALVQSAKQCLNALSSPVPHLHSLFDQMLKRQH